jgi:tetratricopeptide (TPR) repeat protein
VLTRAAAAFWGVFAAMGCGSDQFKLRQYDQSGHERLVFARTLPTADTSTRIAGFATVIDDYPQSPSARTALQQLTEYAVSSQRRPVITTVIARLKAWGEGTSDIAAESRWWLAHALIYGYGDLPAARQALRRLVAAYPDHDRLDDTLWLLGDIYRRQGAWAEARHVYCVLAKLRDEHGWAIGSNRGRFADDAALLIADIDAFILKRPNKAVAAYKHFIERFNDSVLIVHGRLALAEIQLQLGRKDALKLTLKQLGGDHLTQRQMKRLKRIQAGKSGYDRPPDRVLSTLGLPPRMRR